MYFKKYILIALFIQGSVLSYAQFYSIRTNVLGLATGNFNVEGGMTLNKHISVHLPLQFNPLIYSRSRNTKFQNLTVMPGARYWVQESFRDEFVGISLIGSRYNIGNIIDKYRYDGYAAGIGASFGWAYPMAARWNFEWEIGLSALWATDEKFVAKPGGYSFGKEYKWRVFPHRIAINIVYLL